MKNTKKSIKFKLFVNEDGIKVHFSYRFSETVKLNYIFILLHILTIIINIIFINCG